MATDRAELGHDLKSLTLRGSIDDCKEIVPRLTGTLTISSASGTLRRMTPDSKTPLTVSLYFRTSPKVREDAELFAEERSLTLSAALAALVERGLESVGSEGSIRALEAKAQKLGQDLAVLQERDRGWQTMFNSLQGQLKTLRVGKCPECKQSVTAFDQMLVRKCPACGKPMQQVVVEQADEFPPALAALVGAVGGLLFGMAAGQGGGAVGAGGA
jgi:hypothetical protein